MQRKCRQWRKMTSPMSSTTVRTRRTKEVDFRMLNKAGRTNAISGRDKHYH